MPTEEGKVFLKESDTGDFIIVPRGVFWAFQLFLTGKKPSGSIVIDFKDGGICHTETLTKQTYK